MKTSVALSTTILLIGLVVSTPLVLAQTTTPGTKCEDKPFKDAEEREKVKKEDYECYLLRLKYDQNTADSQPLQDINSAIQGIQTGLQFLQQLQSLGGQKSDSGTSGGNTTQSNANSLPNPYLPSNIHSTTSLYSDGSAPSLYFQPDVHTGATTTIVTFGQGNTARSYRITGESFVDVATNETLTWSQVQAREGLRPVPNDTESDQTNAQPFAEHVFTRIDSTRTETTGSLVARVFARPEPASQRSHPLSPNLFTNFSNQFNSAARLMNPNTDLQANVSQEMDFGFNIFSGGIFSPLQNFIVGITNGITALLSLR